MRIKITTKYDGTNETEYFNVDGDDFGVLASELQWALNQCVFRYNPSAARCEDLTAELEADGRTEHGWSTIEYDSGEWA